MCGFTGFVGSRSPLDERRLATMNETLRHRGPDDAGVRLWTEAPYAGLAHRRLSIIDLSPAGHQPMANEDESLWIAFNGEFYNFGVYRAELESCGHVFRSHSDTETILHLYEEHGIEETLRRMNGMFAFAIWDRREKTMVLARDRAGKKPLFFCSRPDGSLLFASEMKALLASGAVNDGPLDEIALAQIWTYGYAMGERTIYRNIRRLLPGHYAKWTEGRLDVREYWDCPIGLEPYSSRSPDDLTDELEHLLCDAIRLRLIADVPVGLFLSGGIDSSLVAALTVKVAGNSLRAFTIAFPQDEFNEAPYAAVIARHLGLEHVILRVDENLRDQFENIVRHFDEPFGDSSCIPTWFVSKLARRHVIVALTGDAGDELFAGYDSYAEGLRLWGDRRQRRLFARPRHGLDILWDLRSRMLGPTRRLNAWERMSLGWGRRCVFSTELLSRLNREEVDGDRERWYARISGQDLLSQMQYINLKTYLPDDILVKVDRMSMAHALECRSPLLDHRVIEFAARLPFSCKIDARGRRKEILRRLLARYVPEPLFERPKQGFAIPWQHWCQGAFREQLIRRWEAVCRPWFRPGLAARIFPDQEGTAGRLAWNAFTTTLFLESRS